MATLMFRIDMPPKGVLETSEDNPELTDELMDEEMAIRQEFIDYVSPRLAALPRRPFFRSGNVSNVELLGANEWTNLNHYLVILAVDIGVPREIDSIVPPGGELTQVGPYSSIETWSRDPEPEAADAAASAG